MAPLPVSLAAGRAYFSMVFTIMSAKPSPRPLASFSAHCWSSRSRKSLTPSPLVMGSSSSENFVSRMLFNIMPIISDSNCCAAARRAPLSPAAARALSAWAPDTSTARVSLASIR
jgi:hypothetical protein